MLQTSKYWLQSENDRNTHHGQLFVDLLKVAFGADEVVMVGHHFVFEPQGAMAALDLTKLNEIPSADTIIFDHDIMGAVFGPLALQVIRYLSQFPVSQGARDLALANCFALRGQPCELANKIGLDHSHA
jgi:hypothetical protein